MIVSGRGYVLDCHSRLSYMLNLLCLCTRLLCIPSFLFITSQTLWDAKWLVAALVVVYVSFFRDRDVKTAVGVDYSLHYKTVTGLMLIVQLGLFGFFCKFYGIRVKLHMKNYKNYIKCYK